MTDLSARLDAYAAVVAAWAPKLDLISPGDLPRFRERHIDDSLRARPLVDKLPPGPAVDVGSGAGLPGIPLALADPSRSWRLLEPRARRAAFLEEVVRELELDCEVSRMTAEDAARAQGWAGAHVAATARAVAPPPDAFRLLRPLLRPGGVAIVFAGKDFPAPPETRVFDPGILYCVRNDSKGTDGEQELEIT